MINWKVRFKNPVWVTSFCALILSTVYQALAMLDIAPPVTQDIIVQVIAAIVQLLTLMGVMVDPTTKGIADSEQAMRYKEPR